MKKYVVYKFPDVVVGIYTDILPACRDVGLDSRAVSRYIEEDGYYMKQGIFIGRGPYYKSKRGKSNNF